MNKATRKIPRFPIGLKAQFFVEEEKRCLEECTIINVNREGMGIIFQTRGKIKVGSTIYLEILVPAESKPINAKGILKWIKEEKDNFIGGITLRMISRGSIDVV